VVICLWALPIFGQEVAGSDRPGDGRAKAGKLSDPGDLEAFFDGALNVQLETKHIAGAVVAVVVGDKVVFTKGYGYADVAARRPVDPEKTMFRVGSISKLFTWTAVMQQVEEGKLDLNTDVNRYLKDVQIPATFEQPITLTDLLTHTPGFEDSVIGLFGRRPEEVGPLADVLRAQMPARVRPPRVLASYSNHGTAIAGYAVACVAGQPWEDYVEQRILEPLGMKHTLVRQPAEEQLPADQSKGYAWAEGHFKVKDFEYIPAAPAGCLSMSAADAARFMLAHLHDGRLGDGRILKPETAQQMRQPLFQPDAKTSAMCYGFMEQRRDGLRLVGHGGDTFWFHSLMQLLPEQRVGLFVSYNTDTGARAAGPLLDAFLRRYFPEADPPRVPPGADAHARARRVAGSYAPTRVSHSTVAKLAALASEIDVTVNDDDTVTISRGDNTRRYVEVEPFVYREVDGSRKVVFKEDEHGRVRYLFLADAPWSAAVRPEWYEGSLVHLAVLGVSLAILASAVLFWPAIAFSVRGLSSPRIKRTRGSAVWSCLAWLLGLVGLALGLGLAWVLSDAKEIAFGLTPGLRGLLAVPQVCVLLAGLTVVGCVVAWVKGYWRVTGRLHYTLVALAGLGLTWFLYYWNLLTFGFDGIVR
jgi:CubicO group peptidase (beta-lactamase class C family)